VSGSCGAPSRRRGPLNRRFLLRRFLFLILAATAFLTVLFFATLPDVEDLGSQFPRTSSFMERRKRDLRRAGTESRLEWTPIPLSRISPALQRAVIVAEDARFWKHEGVDWEAVAETLERDFERGKLRHGASTITQQLAKNLYLSPARTPWRKLREWAIARRLEKALSKKRILELYLNVVEFGPRTYGAQAAARRYFGKPASQLSATEAATLAAIIPSPRIYDPVRHPRRVARRARRILRWMGRPARVLPGRSPLPLSSLPVTPSPMSSSPTSVSVPPVSPSPQ